jgi:hypothetical protein
MHLPPVFAAIHTQKKLITMNKLLLSFLLLAGLIFTQIQLAASTHSKSALPNARMDVTPPVFTDCPANILTLCSPTEPWLLPTATDNCGQPTLVQTSGPVSGQDPVSERAVFFTKKTRQAIVSTTLAAIHGNINSTFTILLHSSSII